MANNLLKSGKIIYPNKLILKKNLKIGLIGSGKIAREYARVINSFGHKINIIISKSKNKEAKYLARNYNSLIYDNINLVPIDSVNAWIVCTSWNKLENYFKYFIKSNVPVLIEKGMPLKSLKLLDYIKKNKKNSNVTFAYNRNYYDFVPYLIEILKKNKLNYMHLELYDSFNDIIKNKGSKITNYLKYYITSHWISLIYKLVTISNYKIINIKKIYKSKKQKNRFQKISLFLKKGKDEFLLDITSFPNGPKNHSCKLYFNNFLIELSPFEKLLFFKSIKKNTINNNNKYIPQFDKFIADEKYKPGFKFMYYDFIDSVYNKKKSSLATNLNDLYMIYKICEKFD